MAYLLDTNVLVRLANHTDAAHALAQAAVAELHRHGETLHITAQNLVEFRAVATRPTSANGLGLTTAVAVRMTATFEKRFSFLPDSPAVYPAWTAIADGLGVIGKQVHDARLVAVCHVHAVSHVLTFNVGHFTRLATSPPGVIVVHPANV